MSARPSLFHYSKHLVTSVRSSDPSKPGCGCYKPSGFWVSVDEPDDDGDIFGWKEWCEAEGFSIENLSVRHHVQLSDKDRLLWITTANDLDWFDSVFGDERPYNRREINWSLVADQFAGVVIAPYQWSRRFDIDWYYGWDCASGVIWDASVVSSINPIVEPQSNTGD